MPIGFWYYCWQYSSRPCAGNGLYDHNSVLGFLYKGVELGIYPPLIFLGVGAMTDFSAMLSQPRLMLLGAAAQIGVFITFFSQFIFRLYIKRSGSNRYYWWCRWTYCNICGK